MTIEQKRQVYTQRLKKLRAMKVEETRKKIAYNGHTDEDDYNYLCPPEGYSWEPKGDTPNGDFHGYRGWSENYAAMLETFPPVVIPESSMCGNFHRILQKFRKLRWHENWDLSAWMPTIQKYGIDHGLGQIHHFCGDSRIGLALGWEGLREKVVHYSKINNKTDEQREFYRAELIFIDACLAWMDRTIEEIRHKLEIETDEGLRENLEGMLEANLWVRKNPPKTLRHACTFISWYNLFGRCYNREGCGGQLDELLRPYYERDIAEGIIDDEDAVYFIAGLLLSDTKYYQLGGPDETGRDMVSKVSWLILEAADRLDVSSNLTIRVHDGLPRDFFRHAVELLFKHKNGWPRFSGDNSLVNGFVRCGYDRELARKRLAAGCSWMSIPGMEYTLNDLVKINVAKVFEVAYFDMMDNEPQNASTELLWQYFERHLTRAVDTTADGIRFHLDWQDQNEPELVCNLLSQGPVEEGRDVTKSARYFNMCIDGAGIATVADSFAACEQRIEREKKITWRALTRQLEMNYNDLDGEYVRQMMLHSERYCGGDTLGDRWAVKINELFSRLVRSECARYPGLNFIPGWFSWSITLEFGSHVRATPNGRRNGEAINHGANPTSGFRKDGAVTAMANSIASVQPFYGNCAPLQLELDPGIAADEEGIDKMVSLIRTILETGNTLLNINLIDKNKILEAHKDPSKYPDLVVRVTGFTAYFAMLSPEFRQLVVDRVLAVNGEEAAC